MKYKSVFFMEMVTSPFASLIDDVLQVIGRYLVRPAHYHAFLLVSQATARALGSESMRRVMTTRYVQPWRKMMKWGLLYPDMEQTPELCLAAVKRYGLNLRDIRHQTPAICLAAVKRDGLALEYVLEQSLDVCLAALQHNIVALRFVKQQTSELCMAAVNADGLALQYVSDKTFDICLAAVTHDGLALEYVERQTPELCLAAVKQNGLALQYVETQTPALCLAAVEQTRHALALVEKPTPELRQAAAAHDIRYGPEPTMGVRLAAMRTEQLDPRLDHVRSVMRRNMTQRGFM
jgi:hypothetical protein